MPFSINNELENVVRILTASAILAFSATTGFAASSFQNTCSEIRFAYQGNQPTIQAVCLRADGSATPASAVIMGVSN